MGKAIGRLVGEDEGDIVIGLLVGEDVVGRELVGRLVGEYMCIAIGRLVGEDEGEVVVR